MAFSKDFQKLVDKVAYGVKALEKQGLTDASPAYKAIRKYAIEQPNSKGSPYEIREDGTIKVKTYKDYAKMSKKEQTAYIESIEKASGLKTINPKKTIAAENKAFREFKQQLLTATTRINEDTGKKMRSPFWGLTKEEYKIMSKAFGNYQDLMGEKFSSLTINEAEDKYGKEIRNLLYDYNDPEPLTKFLQYFEGRRFDLISDLLEGNIEENIKYANIVSRH